MSAPAPSPTALVRGAGPTGSLAALALAQAGWQVTLHDPLSASALKQRRRAYAITHSSRELMQQLGLWEQLEPHCHRFDQLQLLDQGSGASTAFEAANAVGWILDHRPLQALLLQACAEHPQIALALEQAEPASAAAALSVIAEGGGSLSRRKLGIGFWGFRYRQGCLTVQVQLDASCRPHTAWEIFRPEGPLAVLPLRTGEAQVVWSAPQQRCEQRIQLTPPQFIAALNSALPGEVQIQALLDQPAWFPVEWRLAPQLGRGTSLLCGESGHRCHPVGGQGLNLCWRDVASLAAMARRYRHNPRRLVRRYSRRRWLDLLAVLVATDLLVRTFSNRSGLLQPLRRLGIGLLDRHTALRRWSLNLATYGPRGALLTTTWQHANNQPS
ncbi:MAG: FAD-dependent monooxygenase [Synechococcus sp.]|nr:FAD-dependent monooxygenase [Synechococcus sp.]